MFFTLFLIFVTLKFAGLVAWSWLVVFSPMILLLFINFLFLILTGKSAQQLVLEHKLKDFIKNYK